MFGNNKLSKEQYAQEQAQKASKRRLDENLPSFKRDYVELVKRYGIRHKAILNFDIFLGITPKLAQEECQDELDSIKADIEAKEIEKRGIIRPSKELAKA